MNPRWKRRALVTFAVAAVAALGLSGGSLSGAAALQRNADTAGYRLLDGAIDLHLHIDPDTETASVDAIDIAKMKFARAQGIRGFVVKNHYETTSSVAYLIRKEIPGVEAFGAIVMNRNQGGINPAAVEYMATGIKGRPGKFVWMPTYDSENWVRRSDQPNRPFVRIAQNGELLPEVKQVLALIAKHNLVLATGHLSPEEVLSVLREARRQGVKNMIVTHPMDASVFMEENQMREAIKLGAFLEFDYRNVLTGKPHNSEVVGGRLDVIRKMGPENVVINEFWTRGRTEPREYGHPDRLAEWVKGMNARGFTNRELDIMCKENPAKLLGLPIRKP